MDDIKRVCKKCGEEKSISDFYFNSGRPMGKCKECVKADVKAYREKHPEAELATRLKTCEKNPSHKNAYMAVDAALKCGVLIRPNVCSGCGCSSDEHRIEAHHHDYSKPLDVIWLCAPCHEKMDSEKRLRDGKRNHSLSRPVVMKQGDEIVCHFPSMAEAARAVRRNVGSIRQAIEGKSKQCAGFQWAYEDSELGGNHAV